MKIASWNVEGRLTLSTQKRRGTPAKILSMIEKIDADIFVLPEAYGDQPAKGVDSRLRELGYEWRDIRYNELDRKYTNGSVNLHIRVLSRFKIIKTEHLRWNDARSLLSVIIEDPQSGQNIRIIATHLDERSEQRRLAQLKDAITFINSVSLPTVMMGDFNAMHLDDRSKLIQSKAVRSASRFIPHKRMEHRALTLIEMASGSALKLLESETNLRDIDPRHRPTTTPKLKEMEWMPSIRMAQIDHIFVSPDIETFDFKVARDGGSDHRAISANITLKTS
jgi:endonuclease/exonuclease/phosphatase family metal-dependent hydrolase